VTSTVALVRVRLLVSGRVQGVFFRQSTADAARRLGVSGWVRNLPDGRVEAEAEGERAAVDALVAFCRRGPPAAHVDGVEVEPLPPSGRPGEGFSVRR
jgi:acylphosphatase